MSTAGSSPDAAAAAAEPTAPGTIRRRTRLIRWQGLIPMALLLVVVVGGWTLYGARLIRSGIVTAGSRLVGSQVDVGGLSIHFFPPSVDVRGFAIADPADLMKNRIAVGRASIELEVPPLLEKKIVVRRVTVADVQTGSPRTVRARPVPPDTSPGVFVEAKQFAQKVKVPLMSLVPLDSLKAVVLNPQQLQSVQAAIALEHQADSVKQTVDKGYAALNLQPTIDSSAALLQRLQSVNVRTIGIDGARKALADVRRASSRVDSAKTRVERLVSDARKGIDSLQTLVRGIDDARREDYAMARGLLKLPSFDAPEIGAALFGAETMARFQKAVYYTNMARKYAPAGLTAKETPGPKRRRRAGTTVHFVTPKSYPRFLLRRMDANLAGVGEDAVNYSIAAADFTSDPGVTGNPMLFVVRRTAKKSGDSVRVTGSLDHTRPTPRDVVSAYVSGVKLPAMALPMLPYTLDPGTGDAETRFVLDGDRLSGSWSVRSTRVTWRPDSARSTKPLNTMEQLVARALTGITELQLTTEISGTLTAPRLSVRSNLDRVIGDRLRAVAGEEIAKAQAKIKADVDRMVDEKLEPVKAKIADVRADTDKKLAEARTKLDAEKKKLEDKLKSLSGGLTVPRIPTSGRD